MFGTVLLAAGTLMQIYVFCRLFSLPAFSRPVGRRALLAVGAALWILFALGRVYGHSGDGFAARFLEWTGMNWFASLFLASVLLIAVDIVTAFGFLMRRAVPLLRAAALCCAAGLSLFALWQGTRPPVVRTYELRVAELPPALDGITIAAMSDLHLGTLLGRDWLAARITQVQQLHPDMVVLLGDIFEGHGPPVDDLLPEFRRLAAPMGVWSVPGNHESFGRQSQSEPLLTAAGITVLRNRSQLVRPGFVIAGVEDLTVHHYVRPQGDPLAEALRSRPAGMTMLLSHSPLFTREAADAGVDVMLCGHTHGGQIWPFNYFVGRMFPYMSGRYEVNGMELVVSIGTGTWGPRMRLWRPAEIVKIVIRR